MVRQFSLSSAIKGRIPLLQPSVYGNDSTAVGLEHDILQRALNDMDKPGDVAPPAAFRKAIDNNNSIAFVSGVQFDDPNAHFLRIVSLMLS